MRRLHSATVNPKWNSVTVETSRDLGFRRGVNESYIRPGATQRLHP
jgi:hypothetical protein